jgi:hypothetical protein
MLEKVTSCAVIGLDATPVEAEIDTARGLFSLTIVGLPDAAVQESRERARAANVNSGFFFLNQELSASPPEDSSRENPRSPLYRVHWRPDCPRSKRFLDEHQAAHTWVDIEQDTAGEHRSFRKRS